MHVFSSTSYLSPKLNGRSSETGKGKGVYALKAIPKNEILAVWGGEVVTGQQFNALDRDSKRLALQIEENQYLVSTQEGVADWINHSCQPNAGISGQVTLVAIREIKVEEEICYDYAMTDGSDYDEFTCGCHSEFCRKQVVGNDWARPDLWKRYDGYFSNYLQRRIDIRKGTLISHSKIRMETDRVKEVK